MRLTPYTSNVTHCRRRTHALVPATAVVLALLPLLTAAPAIAAAAVERIAGNDRYATAAAVSRSAFTPGVPVVYVATGSSYPDALAGGAAAAALGGPVLLVTKDTIPSSTADELTRLAPGRIVVLGGPAAVSDAVVRLLGTHSTGGVARDAGANRYETAAAISRTAFAPGVPAVYVATGAGFPDALSAGAAAGVSKVPVLLTAPDAVPAATADELTRLHPGRVIVLGGPAAVWPATSDALKTYTAGTVSRLAGPDRYSTSAAVSRAAFPGSAPIVYLATGTGFADALAGGPVAVKTGPGPVLLVPHDCIPTPVQSEIDRLRPARLVLLGGPGAIGDGVQNGALCAATAPTEPSGPVAGGPSSDYVTEAPDYASEAFADPWDYSNSEDIHVGTPQMSDAGTISNGELSFTTATAFPWIDPIPYLPGSTPTQRDGPVAPVDTTRYTNVSTSMYASQPGAGLLLWSTCDWSKDATCSGAMGVAISAGRHIYDWALHPTDPKINHPWNGRALQLRFIPNDKTGVSIRIDWMRLHGAAAPTRMTFQPAQAGVPNQVFYDTGVDPTVNTDTHPGWGLLGTTSGNTIDLPTASLPPGTYRVYATANGRTGPYTAPLTILARPRVSIDSPSPAGGADYSTTTRGRPWNFASDLSSFGRHANICNARISSGVLAANNCGPEINNPYLFLPNPTPIDGNTWHRLTIRLRYDGPFGLTGGPTGGSVARLIWYVKSNPAADQNIDDLVVYPGWQTITVDLKTNPASDITDPSQALTRIGWAGQTITSLRLDPNEDQSNRNFYIDRVQLSRDAASSGGAYDVRFRETSGLGGNARVYLGTSATDTAGVPVAGPFSTAPGENTARITLPTGTPTGAYWPYVVLTGPSGTVSVHASAPVVMSR